MNIHEHQAKEILKEFGAPVSNGVVINSIDEIKEKISKLNTKEFVLKAQIHAGGRGKAGGVKFTKDLKEVESSTAALIGSQLITKQSAPDGQPVNCVLIAAAADIDQELYLGAIIDRASRRVTFTGSRAGGMDIEEVAAKTPEKKNQTGSCKQHC